MPLRMRAIIRSILGPKKLYPRPVFGGATEPNYYKSLQFLFVLMHANFCEFSSFLSPLKMSLLSRKKQSLCKNKRSLALFENALALVNNFSSKFTFRSSNQDIAFMYADISAVTLPVPGLTCNAGQDEPEAEANEGVDSSNNPQGGRNGPGGLVENSSNYSYDDNESNACNGPYLCTADT